MLKYVCLLLCFSTVIIPFPIPLTTGEWYVKEGIEFDFYKNPSEWEKQTQFPVKFVKQKDKEYPEFIVASFFHEVEIPEDFLKTNDETLSILIPYANNMPRIYWNGEKVWESGIFENGKIVLDGALRNQIIKIPSRLVKPGKNQILIHLIGHKDEEITIYGGSNFVLDRLSENIKRNSERIELMLLLVYAYVGIYHLLLFIKRPKERYNLFFGGFAFCIAIYHYTRSNAIFEVISDPLGVIKVEYPSLFITSAFCVFFFEEFFTKTIHLIGKVYAVFDLILSIIVLFSEKPFANFILSVWQKTTLLIILYTLYLMMVALKSKDKDSRRVVFGFIVLIASVILDLVGAMRIIPSLINMGIAKYGFMAFVVGIAFVLANKFVRVHNEAEELNEKLEQKVIERTEQLQKTLAEVQNLKLQQDGDYFLTSLLIRPLMVNQVRSKNVKIDFFIKQKKTFEFKNKIYEIGGDICIANQINLRGKDYTIFINGDAMGKSIQGAGGALVLGVVFRAVIARTQMNTQNDMLPEMWLKSCFIELQNVFVSFDGSMLISVVMGLVEENTGMMYFINAEHPFCVLYRDERASFLEEETVTRKIGILGLDGQLIVKTFHLQPGDVVIIGSDGRDDILVGYDENGQRIINENEAKFLRHVEEGKGELKAITEAVIRSGELTDDYTLLRIAYKHGLEFQNKTIPESYYTFVSKAYQAFEVGDTEDFLQNAKDAIQIYSEDKDLLQKVIAYFYDTKNFQIALEYLEIYLEHFPEDSEYILKASFCAKRAGKMKRAIELGEALRLREPSNVKNLLNLADIYYVSGNLTRANKIAREAHFHDPNNEKAVELIKKSEVAV